MWENLVKWQSRKKLVLPRSCVKEEVTPMGHGICAGTQIKNVLSKLTIPNEEQIKIFCEDQTTISIAKNPMKHVHTKNEKINRYFVEQKIISFA